MVSEPFPRETRKEILPSEQISGEKSAAEIEHDPSGLIAVLFDAGWTVGLIAGVVMEWKFFANTVMNWPP